MRFICLFLIATTIMSSSIHSMDVENPPTEAPVLSRWQRIKNSSWWKKASTCCSRENRELYRRALNHQLDDVGQDDPTSCRKKAALIGFGLGIPTTTFGLVSILLPIDYGSFALNVIVPLAFTLSGLVPLTYGIIGAAPTRCWNGECFRTQPPQ